MKKTKAALPAAAAACLLALSALLAGCSSAAPGSSPQPGGAVPDDPAFKDFVAGIVVSVGESEITVAIRPTQDGGPGGAPQDGPNQPPRESETRQPDPSARPGQDAQPTPTPINGARDADTSDWEQATYQISDQTEIKSVKRGSDGKLQEETADLSSLKAGASVRITLSGDDPTSAASIAVMEGDMGAAPGRPGTDPSPSSGAQRQ